MSRWDELAFGVAREWNIIVGGDSWSGGSTEFLIKFPIGRDGDYIMIELVIKPLSGRIVGSPIRYR